MSTIVDIAHDNLHKHREVIAGDTFLMERTADGRIVATLADGLGSGIKANVLSQLTASMAQRFMVANVDTRHAAQIIMETLPVCSKRHLSYSTLTSLNILPDGRVNLLEYDNPELLWIRNGAVQKRSRESAALQTTHKRNQAFYSEFQLQQGDRLLFFSDGVPQAGMGTPTCPMGWQEENVRAFILARLKDQPDISGKKLTHQVVEEARRLDRTRPKDDISCAAVHYREARNTLLLTGPPSQREKCPYMVEFFQRFDGRKIIAGGTTSQIIAEGISEPVSVDLADVNSGLPPRSHMPGADLVTEGMLTLNKAIQLLKKDDAHKIQDKSAAHRMVQILLESDHLHFLVGTAINAAHQNPDLPVEMGLRRISIKELAALLRKKYLKTVTVEYV